MPDPKRVLWYLRKVPLLADLGPDAIARMAERVELREARRRDVIYLPGDPGRSLFFVHGGRIKVSKVTRDGKSLTLSQFKRKRLIQTEGRKVIISDTEALRALY